MAQIIPPNVLQEQTVIVGPQYAERLIHHNLPPPLPPQFRLRTCTSGVLPGGAEERVAPADQQITDHPLLVCWYLKHLPGDFRNADFCCGGNHITEWTDGGALISQSAPNTLSACMYRGSQGTNRETFMNTSKGGRKPSPSRK